MTAPFAAPALRRLRGVALTLLAAAALACGSHRGRSNDPPIDPPVDPGVDTTVPCGGSVTVRIQGVNGSAFDAFHLVVGALDVGVAGTPVAVSSPLSGSLDLLAPGAWRLGKVALPADGSLLDATLPISGGDAHALAGDAGTFDGCTAPFTFRIDPAQVNAARCHAVVLVDLAGSAPALAGGAGLVLAPRFSLHY